MTNGPDTLRQKVLATEAEARAIIAESERKVTVDRSIRLQDQLDDSREIIRALNAQVSMTERQRDNWKGVAAIACMLTIGVVVVVLVEFASL